MMMMNCGMVDRRKAFSLISSRDHFHRSSPSRIFDTLPVGFKPAQNLSLMSAVVSFDLENQKSFNEDQMYVALRRVTKTA